TADRGAWSRALECYSRALALLDASADRALRQAILTKRTEAQFHLASTLAERREWDSAASGFRDALDGYRQLDDPGRQGVALYRLGRIAAAQGHWEDAKAYLLQALPLLE